MSLFPVKHKTAVIVAPQSLDWLSNSSFAGPPTAPAAQRAPLFGADAVAAAKKEGLVASERRDRNGLLATNPPRDDPVEGWAPPGFLVSSSSSSESEDDSRSSRKRARKKDAKKDSKRDLETYARRHGSAGSSTEQQQRKRRKTEKEEKRDAKKHSKAKKEHKKEKKPREASSAEAADEELLLDLKGDMDQNKIYSIEKRLWHRSDTRTSTVTFKPQTTRGEMEEEAALKQMPDKELFLMDTRGDYNNVLFESLYRMDVAKYKRWGSNRVLLGAKGMHWRLVREVLLTAGGDRGGGGGEYGAVQTVRDLSSYKQAHRYYSQHYVIMERDTALKNVKLFLPEDRDSKGEKAKNKAATLRDFVPLSLVDPSTDDAAGNSNSKENEEGKAGLTFEEHIRERTKEFNIGTRESPHDIDQWFAFVDFQDQAASLSYRQSESQASGSNLLNDKKISVLERALQQNPDNEDLLCELLHTRHSRCSPEELADHWQKAISLHPGSPRLWKEYVLFRQSQFSSFKVSSASEVYASAISSLSTQRRRALNGEIGVFSSRPAASSASTSSFKNAAAPTTTAAILSEVRRIEVTLVSLVVRFCSFQKQAGFVEKSVALLQALVEFNCFTPNDLKQAAVEEERRGEEGGVADVALMEGFEAFWDSDAPRIGDKGAKGWAAWRAASEKTGGRGVEEQDSLEGSSGSGSWECMSVGSEGEEEDTEVDSEVLRWLKEENNLDVKQWKPRREGDLEDEGNDEEEDEVAEEDIVDRMVLLDDIRDYLFEISDPAVVMLLIRAFLQSIGVCGSVLGIEGFIVGSNDSSTIDRAVEMEAFEGLPGTELAHTGNAGGNVAASRHMLGVYGLDFLCHTDSLTTATTKQDSGVESKEQEGKNDANCNSDRWLGWLLSERGTVAETSTLAHSRLGFARRALQLLCLYSPATSTGPSSSFKASSSLRCALLAFECAYGERARDGKESKERTEAVASGSSGGGGGAEGEVEEKVEEKTLPRSAQVARALLKADQMNLRLWIAYAEMERGMGRMKEARKVYSSALKVVQQLPPAASRDAPLLFVWYGLLELRCAVSDFSLRNRASKKGFLSLEANPELAKVLHVLLSVTEGSKFKAFKEGKTSVASPRIIKASKAFAAMLSAESDPGNEDGWKIARGFGSDDDSFLPVSPLAAVAVCFAWVELLTRGIANAIEVFDKHVFLHVRKSEFQRGGVTKKSKWDVHQSGASIASRFSFEWGCAQHEWLVLMKVQLVRLHSLHTHTPPSLYRTALKEGLETFPASPLLLRLFMLNEGAAHMSLRLRSHFDSATSPFVASSSVRGGGVGGGGGDRGGNQGGTRRGGRSRRVVSSFIWLHAIIAELQRSRLADSQTDVQELGRATRGDGGTSSHRVRRLFERALQGQNRSCVALWRLYMRYELWLAQLRREKWNFVKFLANGGARGGGSLGKSAGSLEVKGAVKKVVKKMEEEDAYGVSVEERSCLEAASKVYHRAVHACPWSKKLWIDGLKWLGGGRLSGPELFPAKEGTTASAPAVMAASEAFRNEQRLKFVTYKEKLLKFQEALKSISPVDASLASPDVDEEALRYEEAQARARARAPLSEQQLKEMLLLMTEKEIRIRKQPAFPLERLAPLRTMPAEMPAAATAAVAERVEHSSHSRSRSDSSGSDSENSGSKKRRRRSRSRSSGSSSSSSSRSRSPVPRDVPRW